jgi:hypothetical protein
VNSAIARECRIVAIVSALGGFLLFAFPGGETYNSVLSEFLAVTYAPVGTVVSYALGLLPWTGAIFAFVWALITIPLQNVLTWIVVRYLIDRWVLHRRAAEERGWGRA